MPHAVTLPVETRENVSVPPGHRTKCRTCGAMDNTRLVGSRRLVRCGACGSTVARRRAKRQPKILSYVINYQLNTVNEKSTFHPDIFSAQQAALRFTQRGPVARIRIASIVELLDGARTGNVVVLRYDNYRSRSVSVSWTGGCSECKGRGLVAIRIPARSIQAQAYTSDTGSTVYPTFGIKDKPTIKFLPCEACGALGGELTRNVNYRSLR